jgi:hypothetical protein
MNYLRFVPAGLLIAAFGIALAGLLPRHRLTTASGSLQ